MAGHGPNPKEQSRTRHIPTRGVPRAIDGVGWQHGERPVPPSGLLKPSRDAWETWFTAWFAAHWTPADLPAIRQLIRLYDQVERGEYQRHGEMRLMLDTYGISPKGQQDRRWLAPAEGAVPSQEKPASRYRSLRVVGE
jgi:hypothetical protein